ncbi:MAG: COX15/CtaA family protein [Armatimonadota bacterium]|nr:COX15/CtaA family protein [Armatimonadota bacterium]
MNHLARFCWGVLAYNVLVILWGAFVRATGSGAGCGSHWPTCNGEVIPRPQSVETLIEFTHRATSGLALLAVLVMFVWVFRVYPRRHIARLGASLSLFFIITEALVGAGLVLFEWVAHNVSVARAVSMAVHLANTFLLLASLTLTAWWASGGAIFRLRGQGRLLQTLAVGLAFMLLVGMTGAVIALGDTLTLGLGISPEQSPLVRTLVLLRPIHPVIAVLAGVYLSAMGIWILNHHPQPLVAQFVMALLMLYVVQLIAGAVNVVLKAPVWMQLLHLLLSDVIWIVLVLLAAVSLAAREAPVYTATS